MQEIRRRKIAGLGLRIVAPKFVRVLALFLLACGVAAVAISYWHLKDRTEFRLRPGQAQLSTEVVGEITNLEHREMKGDKLWVVDTGAAKVSAFAVSGGNLTELASSPTVLPSGAHPFGIVVN